MCIKQLYTKNKFVLLNNICKLLKCYDCLLFSWIIISYPLVGVFEFLVVLLVPRSTDFPVSQSSQLIMSTKKNSSDYLFYFLCPLFSDATLLAALSQKKSTIFWIIPFEIVASLDKHNETFKTVCQSIWKNNSRKKKTIIVL